MTEKQQKTEKKERYVVGEVATQTAPVILDEETGKQYTLELAVARVLNNQEKLMKLLD